MTNIDISASGELKEPRSECERPSKEARRFDGSFWAVFVTIAIIGTITWLAIFEHNYHPRIYRYSEEVTSFQVGESELAFNHPPGAFTIWWQSGEKNVRVWPKR